LSFVEIYVPDDKWFEADGVIMPKDKMFCEVIHKYGNQCPRIYQFRKADWLNRESNYFLDVSAKWTLDSLDMTEGWNPSFATMSILKKWKPLGLPPNENERLLLEIEKWFED
jgi:hypothetical protein